MQTIKPIMSHLDSPGGIQRDSSTKIKSETLRCEDKNMRILMRILAKETTNGASVIKVQPEICTYSSSNSMEPDKSWPKI